MNNPVSEIHKIILSIESTLSYFGLFKYPLSTEEIHRFLGYDCDYIVFVEALTNMIKEGKVILSEQNYYSLQFNPEWSLERNEGNRRASDLLIASKKYVKRISSFPFVSSVAISGSLSKYYAGVDADIDYFIITKKNRLWISRTLLHFYKKFTFLVGHEHYYCMNYFIDESALEIDQKNVYSAIETVTLIPSYNKELIDKLKLENKWVNNYLPNETYNQDLRFLLPERRQFLKRFFESMINILNPTGLNRFLMDVTDRKWRRKWKKKSYPMENYNQAFYTSLNVSKNHPDNYQSQILTALDTKGKINTQSSCGL